MAKKVNVNKDACIGCGLCIGMIPEAVTFGDDGKADCIGEADDAAVEEAVNSCPVGALEAE